MEKIYKTVRLKDIKPYENNPRHNEEAINAVKESIIQCGYVAPIIVDENMVILAGHTRHKALKELNRTSCEVLIVEGLSDEEKRKYRLLDNKTNELATWDFEKLENELMELDFGNLELNWMNEPINELMADDAFPPLDELEAEDEENEDIHFIVKIRFQDLKQFKKHEDELRELLNTFDNVSISFGEEK